MNQTVYAITDDQGFISDFKLTAADGYTPITVPLAWVSDFMKYPTKFSIIDGALKAPGNLPTLSIDELKQKLDKANDTIDTQQGTITQLQQAIGTLTGQIALMSVGQSTATKDGE